MKVSSAKRNIPTRDKFFVYISDFYPELNDGSSNECFLEFSSDDIEDIKNLRGILGRHVCNKEKAQNGDVYVVLAIEWQHSGGDNVILF